MDLIHLYFLKLIFLDNDEVLDDELITYKVLTTDGKEGKVNEVFFAGPTNKIIRVFVDKEIIICKR